LRDPIKYEAKNVGGPGSPGELLVKDKEANVKRVYTPLDMPNVPILPGDRMAVDANGLPVIMRPYAQFSVPVTALAAANLMFGVGAGPAVPSQFAGVLHRAGLPLSQSQALGTQMAHNQNSLRQTINGAMGGLLPNTQFEWNFAQQIQIPVGGMIQDAQRSAQVAEQQLEGDVQAINDYNLPIEESNKRVRQVLTDSTTVDVGAERVAWEKWLVDLFGFAYSPQKSSSSQPTIVQQVPLSYQPEAIPVVQSEVAVTAGVFTSSHHSCFAGGTPVRTIDGLHPIETLRIGDQVLTQNPRTGALKYQAVVTVFHNPPNATLRIKLANESIVATGIHRLWKAGQGWVMARDLKAGDILRTLDGTALIKSITEEKKQPVFNLHVADGESFFVGSSEVLAHDNSLINPTPEPFDGVKVASSQTKN
jgi:hypothetical protein